MKIQKHISTLAMLFGLSLISFGFLGTVAAAATTTFPGALCQPHTNDDAIKRHFRGGVMSNESSSSQWWLCPMAKSTPPVGLPSAYIVVTGLDVSCELFSRTSTTILVAGRMPDITFIEDGLQVLVYTASIADSGDDDYYIFRCLVPPGGGVASYGYPAPVIVD